MDLKFELRFSRYFDKQFEEFNSKEKHLIWDKLKLVKENPHRFKPLKGYRHLFEIKLTVENKYSRLIYAAFYPNKNQIKIFGVFPRDKDFKDFYKLFKEDLKKLK